MRRELPVVGRAQDVDLNGNRVTRFLLTNRYVQPTLQLVVLAIFVLALWRTFTGPQDPDTNFGVIAFFGLWWAPFMIVSLLLIGRVWCYVCPIGAVTQFLQRFSLDLRFPTFLKPKLRVLGLPLSVLSIAAVTFVLARFPLYKLGVAITPWKAGVYFLVFVTVAVGLTLVFRQRVFCRYVCPATGVMSVTTRLSPAELRQDRDSHVADCMTAEFKSNYLSTERRCVSCMACTKGEPEQPVRLHFRWPGAAAVRQRLLIPDEALLALVVWAVFPIDHVLGSRILGETAWVRSLPPLAAEAVPYLGSIAAAIGAFALVSRVAAWWGGLDAREAFVRFAFAYVPLGILFQLGRHVVTGLMESGGALVNGFAAGLGVSLGLPAAWAAPETIEAWSRFSESGGLWLSVLWAAGIAWFVARDLAENRAAAIRAFVPHLLLMAGSTFLVVSYLA